MDIFILRHGDANASSKKLVDDSKRALSDTGIKEIEGASRFFSEFEIKFDHIFSSPLRRARQTADLILKGQKKSQITEMEELKPEGRVEEVAKRLGKQKEDSVILIIGHNPLLINLINYIVNEDEKFSLLLKTGSFSKIRTTSLKPRLKGELELLVTPKVIRKVSK